MQCGAIPLAQVRQRQLLGEMVDFLLLQLVYGLVVLLRVRPLALDVSASQALETSAVRDAAVLLRVCATPDYGCVMWCD